ncbi:unnamed protein product [Adineta ricciae]|uniref:Uncharacterized protein n=1 Tax=Adineta ricciae TaxID=249248 RepID=A0A814BMD4_ADIRI|nr:unnamed protein product [Adineta ricciae]
MFRVFLFVAFVALSTGAPYGDINSQRSLPPSSQSQTWGQQAPQIAKLSQQDETELVDSLGGGYSFFKKQPIVARPLIQQQLAIKDQPAPISSFDDTSNQWSDYTKASAFKTKPKVQIVSSNKDLLIKDQSSYGSGSVQQQIPVDTGAQFVQQDLTQPWSSKPTVLPQQPLIRDDTVSGYGQQQVLTKSWSPKPTVLPQQPLIRDDAVSGYGQQQDLTKSWSPKPSVLPQQPLIRDDAVSGYGQQDLQKQWAPKANIVPGQQNIRILVQQQPLIRDETASGYGQQQDLIKSWSSKPTVLPQQPLIRDDAVSGYGQQQDLTKQWTPKSSVFQGQQNIRTLVQQQPLIRDDAVSGYGQQQDLIKPWSSKPAVLPQQPLIRDDTVSGYGQQQDLTKSWSSKPTVLPQQPLIRDDAFSGYGQQDLQKQWAPKSNIGFADQSVRTLVQQQPLFRPEVGSFSQQSVEQQWAPTSNVGTGQNWDVKLSGPVVNTVQSDQSSWSTQQNDFSQQVSPMTASRSAFQSAPFKQSSDSGSFAGW